jgi:hypothetical protein
VTSVESVCVALSYRSASSQNASIPRYIACDNSKWLIFPLFVVQAEYGYRFLYIREGSTVSYECETWCPILKEEHTLKSFENGAEDNI